MKKYDLLKIIGISFLIVFVLSWIIPAGMFSNGEYVSGSINPLGFLDIIRIPLMTISNYIHYAIAFLVIGGLYGVLNKTGAYGNLVNGVVNKFKDNKSNFLIISIIGFALLSSLTGLHLLLFVLVPFMVTVILLMNYSKITALLSTVGAILVGIMGSTYGFSISGHINHFFVLQTHSDILSKFIILGIFTYILIIFVLKLSKKDQEKEVSKTKKDLLLFDNKENKNKSGLPIVVLGIMFILITIIGMYNFKIGLGVHTFENLYNSIMNYEINNFPIISNIIGGIGLVGFWNIYEFTIILLAFIGIVIWVYGIKIKDALDGFLKGAKDIAPTAFYVTLVFLIYSAVMNPVNGQNIFYTISNVFIGLTDNINYIMYGMFSGLGSLVFGDFTYFIGNNAHIILGKYVDSTNYPVLGMIHQMVHGLVSFIAPTSLLLIAGLSYLKISYKEWFKTIWKLLVQLLIVVIVITVIMIILI